MKLTQRQETFCVKYFELGNASEAARIAGYSPRTVRAIASINLTKVNIQERLKELRQKVEDESIASVMERKQRLSAFIREDNYGKFGISRQSNIAASDQLNKMEKIYTDGSIVNVDNRKVEINIGDPKEQLLSLLGRYATRTGEAEGDNQSEPAGS